MTKGARSCGSGRAGGCLQFCLAGVRVRLLRKRFFIVMGAVPFDLDSTNKAVALLLSSHDWLSYLSWTTMPKTEQ